MESVSVSEGQPAVKLQVRNSAEQSVSERGATQTLPVRWSTDFWSPINRGFRPWPSFGTQRESESRETQACLQTETGAKHHSGLEKVMRADKLG